MGTQIFTEAELRSEVRLSSSAIDAIASGFALLTQGKVHQPPILRVDVPESDGEVDVKSAYVVGWNSFAVKVSTGFFRNPGRGLPAGLGLMVLLSAETGETKAVLLDNGYLTSVRTALAGAVAARALAPHDVEDVGVLGAGDQARWQMRALAQVRSFARIHVWARRRAASEQFAAEMTSELGVSVRVRDTPREVVEVSRVVVTTTPSREPLVHADWLHPGLHITAMGSDAEHKRELGEGVLERADLLACDHVGQSERLGELRAARESGAGAELTPVELGSIVSGAHPGRTDPAQVTVCDLTGTGVQDTVIARIAFDRCLAAGLGRVVVSRED